MGITPVEWSPPAPRARGPQAPAVTPPPVRNLTPSVLLTDYAADPTTGTPASAAAMPQPGDQFFGFRLVEELGHGTFARVFLAKQESLAGRDVALKVTLRPTREAERLARLQHTNIVPVYSVHTANPVQLICMPYLGRRTIADVLTGHRTSHVGAGLSTRKALGTRKGSTSVAGSRPRAGWSVPVTGTRRVSVAPAGDPTGTPIVGNVEAVLRLLGQLAAGLAHAHDRGILHLDLKPANVLFADTGEPMLLDFNLSFDAAEANREVVGGTIPYMAPEQLADLRSRGKGTIDARTDLYALGVMAFELLSGQHPFAVSSRNLADFDGLIAAREKGPPSLNDLNPDVTPAVEAVVRKLLAPSPEDRYQSAADLRDDIDRQLTDRPLRFAPDRSLGERFGKWRRRNPQALVAFLVAAVLAVAGGAGGYAFNQAQALATKDAEARAQKLREQLDPIRLDLVLAGDPQGHDRGTKRALAILRQYGLPDDPNWQQQAAFRHLPEAERAAVAGDLGELLLLVAHVRWEDGKGADPAGAATDALLLNRIAEGCFTAAPPFLFRQRAELEAAGSGQPAAVPQLPAAQHARDHFLEAIPLMGAGEFKEAGEVLKRAIAAQPTHAAANFFVARCRHQHGEYEGAHEWYEAARLRMPTDPRSHYYAGIAFGMRRKHGDAEDAFTRAIELDPDFGPAYRNRGIARMEQDRPREAEADFTAALARGVPPIQAHLLRARVRDLLRDEAGAASDRAAVAAGRPETETDFITLGYVRLVHDPRGALAAFRTAAEKNPRSLPALQQQAAILADVLRDDGSALLIANRMVELYPSNIAVRAGRAIHLARLGRREEAHREAEQCRRLLDALPPRERDGGMIYRLALVYAQTSRSSPADRVRAVALLREAVRTGYHNAAALERDRDLAPIRELPEFAPILKAVKELTL